MEADYIFGSKQFRDLKHSSSVLTCDIKSLVKLALDSKKSKHFCSKINVLAKLVNSRHTKFKIKLYKILETKSAIQLVNELIIMKVYLHPEMRHYLGKYLIENSNIEHELHKKVR